MAEVIAFEVRIDGIDPSIRNTQQLTAAINATRTALSAMTINSPERAQLAQQLANLTSVQENLNRRQREAVSVVGAATGSYRAMNLELGQLRTRYRDLSEADRSGAIGTNLQRQIQSLNTELVRLDAGIGNYQRNIGNYASAFKGFGNVITGVLAGLGVGFGASQILEATSDYSKAVSELQAITGVSGQGLEDLKNKISELTTITLEGGQVIVSSGKDIADALKLAGSARPELLSNTEALAAFTKEAIVFAKAGSLPVQDAVSSLSSVLSQFEEPASSASRVINELAAGSKLGASEIKNTAAAIEKFGAGAKQANISTSESIALVETLGDKFIFGAEAGTQIRNILNRINAPEALGKRGKAELDKYGVSLQVLQDKTIPLGARLTELSKIAGSATAITKVFGAENQTAGQILLNNIPRYEELSKAVVGTNEAYVQASINADNLAQLLSNLKNGAINLAVGIGTNLYNAINVMIGLLNSLATFIDNNKVALLAAGFAVAAYSASLNSTRLVLLSFQAAQAGNTLVTNAAAIAQKGLSLAMAAVPYVAVGVAIYALISVMQEWFGATEEQIKTQEVLLASQKELTDAYASEAQSAAELFAIAKSDVSSKEQKAAAVQRIIELYPDYLGGFRTETDILNNLDAVQKSVNKGILDGAIARVKAQKIQEATASLIDLELKKQQLLFEFQKSGTDLNTTYAAAALKFYDDSINETKKRIADLPTFLSKVGEGLSNQNIDFTGLSVSDSQIKEVQKQIVELNAFRFNLIQTTGKDLDEEGKKRYDFLLSEEKRLQAERQKLIDSNLKGEQVAAQKSVAITEQAEAKKDKAKGGKEGKTKEVETLETLQAKLIELQGKLSSLKDTPSKIPTSLFDDITKTKKEIDELTEKLRKAGLISGSGKVFSADGIKEAANEITNAYDETFTEVEQGQSDLDKRLKQLHDDYLAGLVLDEKTSYEELSKAQQAKRDEDAKKEVEQRKEVQQLLLNSALDLAREISDNVFNIQKEANNRELENKKAELETSQQAELDLANNNATLISAINERYAAQKEALDRKAFEENKRLAIAQALINGALAATAVFTVPDFTFGVASAIRLGFIAANTAIQVGAISAQKFSQGGEVKGVGTGTSDSNLALLSRGEVVIKESSVRKLGIDNVLAMNDTGQIPSSIVPAAASLNGGFNEAQMNQLGQVIGYYVEKGANSGVNDGLVTVNRETNILNKLK